MALALALPRFVVIQSVVYNVRSNLRYVHEDVQVHGFLQFTGEEIVSPYSKFEVERAQSGNGLVHIRCCYNNKYWVTRSKYSNYIMAAADEPEEDQSLWSCTLFEPLPVNGANANTLRFRHVQSGLYLLFQNTSQPYWASLFAQSTVPSTVRDVFEIVDWESLVILPKNVAFKGDNELYLSARTIERYPYLQFASTDHGDSTVGNEVFITPDGSIRIKNNHFNRFWRRSPNWIWADSNDTTNGNLDTLFRPVKVSDNVIALRNLGNNNFCKRFTHEGKTSCLNAAGTNIDTYGRLVVEELVISRSIYNVNYRLLDARVYGERIIEMASATAPNATQATDSVSLGMSYTDSKSTTWNSNVSLKLGITTTFTAGLPLVASGEIEISTEFSGGYEWGETLTTESEVTSTYTATVEPMTRVTVSLLGTRATCDIPFSYTQRDTLMNGEQVTYNMDDGIFTGVNNYNFYYDVKRENLL